MKHKLAERSTQVGLIAIGLGAGLLLAAFFAPTDRFANIKDAVEWLALLIGGGVAGVLYPERKDPPA